VKAVIASPFLWPPTQLTYVMANELESLVRGIGWDVIRLQGPQNLRVFFSFVMNSHPDAVLIAYMGHAGPSAFLGEDIFGLGILGVDNAGEVREHVVVGMPACLSAQQLGPALVKAGAKAFVGSREEMYAQWSESEHDYMADWFDYTLTFYKSLVTSLTAGKSVKESLEKALNDYRERCTYYEQLYKQHIQDWPNSDFYLHAVKQNRDFVVGYIR
jgi:hypothetical protein